MRGAARAALVGVALLAAACGDGSAVLVGTLERDRIELVAEAQEPIVEILVREGDAVEPGRLLLRQDATRLGAELREREGNRTRAAARVAELERGTRAERIEQARARLEGARQSLRIARRELERARSLRDQGVASQEAVDRAERTFEQAQAERDAAEASLAERVTGPTAEELAQARAGLAAAEGAAAALRVRLERLSVRAPRAATVDALPFEEGERPPPGATVAVLLADGPPWARVFVPEPVRVRVRPGTAAVVRVDGLDRDFRGRVRRVSREAAFTPFYALTERDRSRLAFEAEIDLVDDAARALPAGIPVEVAFDLSNEAAYEMPGPAPGAEAAGP